MQNESNAVDWVERLAADPGVRAPAFQSVLAVVVRNMLDVLAHERAAADASISLGQREMLDALIEEAVRVHASLSGLLVHAVTSESVASQDSDSGDASSWWFALAEATHELELMGDRLSSLVGSQPRGSAVRDLVSGAVRLFHSHHQALLQEAARWMEG